MLKIQFYILGCYFQGDIDRTVLHFSYTFSSFQRDFTLSPFRCDGNNLSSHLSKKRYVLFRDMIVIRDSIPSTLPSLLCLQIMHLT